MIPENDWITGTPDLALVSIDELPEEYLGKSDKYVSFQAKSTSLFRNGNDIGNNCRKSVQSREKPGDERSGESVHWN
jgi:hypothetical protein